MRQVLAIVILLLTVTRASAGGCAPDTLSLRGDWGQVRFSVEIADDNEARAQGLMYRTSLPRFAGMLFVYDAPTHARFWMKNTYIPLDMLFIGPDGRVLKLHENAIPKDRTGIDGGEGVLAVLEINGGLARSLGIGVGSELQHPAFGANAAWPCE